MFALLGSIVLIVAIGGAAIMAAKLFQSDGGVTAGK